MTSCCWRRYFENKMAADFQLLVLIVACLQGTKEVQGSSNTTASEIHSSVDQSVTIAYLTDGNLSTQADAAVPIPYACPSTITQRHSCNGGCSGNTWTRTRYCQCDPLCVEYDDCCPDYTDVCGRESKYESSSDDEDTVGTENADIETNTSIVPTSVGSTGATTTEDPAVTGVMGSKGGTDGSPPWADYMDCIQTTDFDPDGHRPRSGHRLVAVCPHDWSGDPGIRELCQKPPVSDGLAGIPVEGTAGRHYKNVYCAMCHGVPHANATFWSVSYQAKQPGNVRLLNASLLLQMAKEKTASKAFTTSLNPPGYTDGGPPSPNLAASTLRSCVILDPSPCPVSGADAQNLCRLHFAPMASNGTTYRNLACLRCDDQPAPSEAVLEDWCWSLGPLWPSLFGRGSFLSLATLLIFSDHADVVGPSGEDSVGLFSCWEGQIYDPFLEVCRDMTCPDGFVLEDGVKCARMHAERASADPELASVEVSLTVAGSLHEGDTPSPHESDEIWGAIARQAAEDFLSTIPVCKSSQDADGISQMDQFCEKSHLTWTCSMGVAILNSAEPCVSGSVFSCSVNMSLETPSPFQSVAENELFPVKCFLGSLWNFTIRPDYFAVSTPCGITSNETRRVPDGSYIGLVLSSKVAFVWDDRSGHLKLSQNDSCMEKNVDCPLLTFSKDDYEITGVLNDSIRLTLYDRILRSGEFNMKDNGEVEVCNFLQRITPPEEQWGWDQAHFILNVSGSTLSLIGLIVTVATYVAFPPLRRNAAGKSLMSLVAALFFAQLTMLVGLNRTEVIAVCIAFAIGSHFLWLAAFFWMNILAVDIYRTFGVGTRLGDPNSRSFGYYALYGWGAPTLIVCTCVVLSFCDCVEVDINYGSKHACWIGNGTANMVSFGLPIVVILCSNAVLFSLTVAGVRKTRMTSKRMNITQGQNNSAARRPNAELILYLKLTAIMGFTWVFGFVASFSGIQFFWYPFIVLNSLQGALVCLAFVCNKRVVGMWRARLKGSRRRYADSDTSSTRQLHQSYQTSTAELTPAEISTKMTNV